MTALLVICLIWLLVLTVMILAIARQVGQFAIAAGVAPELAERTALVSGLRVSPKIVELFASHVPIEDPAERYVLWLSTDCDSCLEVAEGLAREGTSRRLRRAVDRSLIVATGNGRYGMELFERLDALADRAIADPAASDVVGRLSLPGPPFALALRGDVIAGWAQLSSLDAFESLARSRQRATARERRTEEVSSAASQVGRDTKRDV
jgi:hypothetical protein